MLPCCPGSTSINKARGTKCFWMGASCWQDLSRLFIEGLVSCYHWDVAACGNSGENRPLMPPPLGSPTPFFCFPFDGVLWSVLRQQEADLSTPTQERRGGEHTRWTVLSSLHTLQCALSQHNHFSPLATMKKNALERYLKCWFFTMAFQILCIITY